MKRYCTKWALSHGILEVELMESRMATSSFAEVRHESWRMSEFVSKTHLFQAKQGAIEMAEKMRAAKLKSLQKQIDKIKALNFSK